jgi:hypothetical protein
LDKPVLQLLRKLQVPVASEDLPKDAAFDAARERGFLQMG